MELKGDLIHTYLKGITAERSDMQQQYKKDPRKAEQSYKGDSHSPK